MTMTAISPEDTVASPVTAAPPFDLSGNLRWIRVGDLVVLPQAQREFRPYWVRELVLRFDPDAFGLLEVSERNGVYNLVDGQHRAAAVIQLWGKEQKVQCVLHTGLSEREEALLFLSKNNTLTVGSFDKFRVAVTAGMPVETEIAEVIEKLNITIAKRKGSIWATTTLRQLHRLGGPALLHRTLNLIITTYGEQALEASTIRGIGAMLHRYSTTIDDTVIISRLSAVHGQYAALLGRAEVLRRATRKPRWECIACAVVDTVNWNSGKHGGLRLPGWWRTGDLR
jgi:hypothetical protein